MNRFLTISLLCLLGVHCFGKELVEARSAITNPVIRAGADPSIVHHRGTYHLTQSRRGSTIWVNSFADLADIGTNNWVNVWTPPTNTPYSRNVWAPELRFLRGSWYIYFAADDGKNENHRMYVLQGTADNPRDPFEFKGKIAAKTDRWAIDGSVVEMADARLYFVWSGWDGFVDGQQNLYIAPMSDPLTISGERVLISKPEHDWECRSTPTVNEGPQALWNGLRLFLIYSASGSWTDDYCLGRLAWTGGDPLLAQSWVKSAQPVFARTDTVFGPGHACFVKSPDGSEDWIVYHSAQARGFGWRRQISMQSFSWNADGSPSFGKPVTPGVAIPAPSKD